MLEIVTRHIQDRYALGRRQRDSVVGTLGDQNWIQTVLVDPHRLGVPSANERLRSFEPWARYVWILDDDDVCEASPLLLMVDPDVDLYVFRVFAEEFDEPIPLDTQWDRRTLEPGFMTPQNFVISARLWMEARSHWESRISGDIPFIYTLVAQSQKTVWIDRTIARIDESRHGA